ncbi:exopolysaccharide biosynthesis protein [Thioclava litoralis]|uniref:Exopolysaccharide biosynthesis protein n=1 Tax=Thioclava litoralis TaxID=3076557 RepID=A0ABZ1E0M8_9RHOB|nr:exopolysaccharide biosynthesis protein [Thioclava sp. FTW29]
MQNQTQTRRAVRDIVAAIDARARDEDEIRIEDVLGSLGGASFVPVLLVPALFVVSPLSGIPLFSSACGILIALISAQMLLGRDHLWLPRLLTRRHIAGDKLRKATGKLQGIARWMDLHTKERLRLFTHRPFRWVTQGACLLCGAAMPFLELVPFSSSILGAAVTLLALSLLVRDGLIALFGLCFIGLACGVGYWAVSGTLAA